MFWGFTLKQKSFWVKAAFEYKEETSVYSLTLDFPSLSTESPRNLLFTHRFMNWNSHLKLNSPKTEATRTNNNKKQQFRFFASVSFVTPKSHFLVFEANFRSYTHSLKTKTIHFKSDF